ncbi:MAG: hypothetical protein EOP53_18345, partial [Sphingobacteriales bacterium]
MDSKKKILIIINSLGVGGAENQVVNILNQLKEEFEFHVITLIKNDPNFVKRIDQDFITIHPLDLPQKAYYFPIAFLKILAIAKKLKPHVVHSI